MTCIFCKIISGEIPSHKVYEDDKFIAFLDINPLQPGHILIIPKHHVDDLFDLPKEIYTELFEVAKKLQVSLRTTFKSKRVGLIVEGFGVAHAHLHLVPINELHQLDPHKAKKGIPQELKENAERLKKLI